MKTLRKEKGRSMGAYAEAFARDRWRVYKCEERLRVVNLGGTAIGTGLGAPRAYIFRCVDRLKTITGFGLARAENLVECTQNADVFVEVSGILNAFLPLVADRLLDSLDILARAATALRERCVEGLKVNADACGRQALNTTATVTALVERFGYATAGAIAEAMRVTGRTARDIVMERGLLTEAEFDQLLTAEAVMRLGSAGETP